MNNNVLLVSYYWPPSGGAGVQRPLKFAKYLPAFDVQPFVLTVENPTYPIVDESLANDIPKKLKVFKSKTIEPFSIYSKMTGKSVSDSAKPTIQLKKGNWGKKLSTWIRANLFLPDARFGWLLTARSRALAICKQYNIDAIITTGPPHSVHFVGKHVKEKMGIQWIADFRDPWSSIFYNQLMPRTDVAHSIDERLERSVLETADDVVVISKSMVDIERQVFDRPYHVIPNGFDHEDFNSLQKKPQNDQDILIRHIGSIGELSVPHSLFKALSELPNSSPVKVEFIGNVHPDVHQLIEQYGLQNRVELTSYIPHDEAIQAMKDSDLLLLVIPDSEDNELILTGKLFEYIGTQNPILMIGPENGDAADILNKSGHHYIFEHEDEKGLAQLLLDLSSGKVDQKTASDIKDLKNHPFSRYKLTGQLSQIIN
ncbi:glycosyltransferase family 4 protein [Aliifodinibius sp. S!AR15-10]|uniref:glycosyltransferase family 4 protein n=1 Tax=Aliifodinibius sp. S!AR15-10 TaxID=2950437 RepID=UPI002860D33A|nr:glycosyltransferase family 4 protein [Aliifodinibius sp. S!AR15-10]MDR8394064.1 glycosyltransferase family 4 protein [Aliifodinibius sp. S!AR15-10]